MSTESGGLDEKTVDRDVRSPEGLTITFEEDAGGYRVTVESPRELPPSMAVVRALGAISRTDLLELEPLAEYVDPDALDGIFESIERTPLGHATVSFPYAGYQVTVVSSRELRIDERDQ